MSLIENIANNIKVLHKVKSVPTNTSKIGIHLVEGGGVYIVSKDPITPTLRVVKKIYERSDHYLKGETDTLLQNQKDLLDAVDQHLQTQVTTVQQTTATQLAAQKQLLDDADAILQSQVTAVQQTTATHTAEIQNIKDEYVANKGYYNSLATLQAAYPTPEAGDVAYVADVASTTGYYIHSVVGGAWAATSIEAPPVGVAIEEYTKTGGSTKTTQDIDDDLVQLTDGAGLVKYIAGDNIIAELTNSEINDNDIWEDGQWSKNTGEESPSDSHRRTKNFYEIAGDVDFNYHFRLAGNAGVCFYDKDRNFINAIWNEAGEPSGIIEGSITTDKKARLFKVSHAKLSSPINIYLKPTETKTIATSDVFLRSDDLPEYTKTGGSTKTTQDIDDTKANHGYDSNPKTLKEVEDEIVQLAGETGLVKYTAGDNIIAELTNSEINDNDIWEDGQWSKNTGEESPSDSHRRTKNFYEIAGDVDFNYHFRLAGNAGVCFYDKDRNFINAIWNEAGEPSGIIEGSITTDKKARLFKVSHAKLSSPINIYLKPTETKTIATSDVFLRSDDLPEFKTILDPFGSGIATESAIAEFIKKTQDMSKIFLKGGQKQLINTENAVQLDLYLDTQGVPFSLGANLKFRGIKNGADYPIYFVDTTRKRGHSTNLYLGSPDAQINHVFLNVEDVDSVELFLDTNNPYELSVKTELHKTYLDGREFNFMDWAEFNAISASKAKLMYGYKYYQIVDSVDCSDATFKQVPNVRDVTYAPLGYNILTKVGEKITGCTIAMHNSNIGLTVVEDGYIYQPSGRAALVRPNASLNMQLSPEGSVIVSNSKVICRNAVNVKEVEREYNDFNLMRVPSSTLNKDAFNGSVIEWRDRSITYYINGYWGIKQLLQLHNVLDANDKIEQAFLIPFQRSLADSTEGSALRIWLFTAAGKCYYNYATDDVIYYHHVNTWAESKIFNQFKNWVPVNDKSKVTTYKKYFPVLSEYDYSQTNDISNPSTIYERPFTRLRNAVTPFHVLTKNNIARLDHVTAFSNYCNQIGQEPFVMLTSDGGKTWYVKAYFAVTDQYYTGTHGGLVDFSPISDLNTYVENSLKVHRRRYNHPTAEIKEPSTRFTLVESESALVKSFSYDSSLKTMKMEVSEDIDWIDNSNFNVVYFENISADSEWDYICNTGLTPNAATTSGIFFRVKKINAREYHLFADAGNDYEGSLVCRHVHAINSFHSGFVISTGESKRQTSEGVVYEGGDLFVMEDTTRNHSTASGAIKGRQVYRLTSSDDGVMRCCGAFITQNNELIFSSDQGFLIKDSMKITDRTISIPKVPVGIFKGKLSEIDDVTKFECLKDLEYTTLSLLHNEGRFACDYKHGHIVVSHDGIKWVTLNNIRELITGLDNNGDFYVGSDLKLEWK